MVKVEPSCMLHPAIVGAYESNKANVVSQNGIEVLAGYSQEVKGNYGRQIVSKVDGKTFLENPSLHQEVFGPFSLLVECEDKQQLEQVVKQLEGQLTGTIIGEGEDVFNHKNVTSALQDRVVSYA